MVLIFIRGTVSSIFMCILIASLWRWEKKEKEKTTH